MKKGQRFPSQQEVRAVELGVDELHARLEWGLRGRPRALRAARRKYRDYCGSLLAKLELAK
jgi:hypothetical protein